MVKRVEQNEWMTNHLHELVSKYLKDDFGFGSCLVLKKKASEIMTCMERQKIIKKKKKKRKKY